MDLIITISFSCGMVKMPARNLRYKYVTLIRVHSTLSKLLLSCDLLGVARCVDVAFLYTDTVQKTTKWAIIIGRIATGQLQVVS